MRQTTLGIALAGAALCMALLLLSYLRPVTVENWARQAIATQISTKLTQEIGRRHADKHRDGQAEDGIIARHAEQLMEKNRLAIEQANDSLQRELPAYIDKTIQSMLDPACPCRAGWRAAGKGALKGERDRLLAINAHLGELVESKYRQVATALLRELRIFSAANGAAFLLLGLLAWRWKRATLQLLAPAAVLLGAIVTVAGVYLFSQNWLQTILLGDYVGYMYLPYLAIVAAFMADVVMNRARLSTQLINAILTLVGSAATAIAC